MIKRTSRIVAFTFLMGFLWMATTGPVLGVVSEDLYRRALDRLETNNENLTKTFGNLRRMAGRLARAGHLELSIELYTALMDESPENPDLLLGRGQAYRWKGLLEKSLQDLDRAASLAPDYPGVHHARARTYFQLGRYDRAVDGYNRLAELKPDDPDPLLEKARVLIAKGRPERARDVLEEARRRGASESELQALQRRLHNRPSGRYWTLGVGADRTLLDRGRDNWSKYRVRFGRHKPERTILLEYNRRRRFGLWNDQYSLDVYQSLWERAYVNGTYRHSPEHDFLPRHDGRLELFQGFGSGFEGSLNARFMNFDAVDVDIYGLSLGRYWNDWYVRGNLSRSQDTRNSQGTFGQLTVRNYYRVNNDDYWEGSVGLGKDQVNVGPTRQSLTQTTESFTLLWHRYWTRKWGTELSYRYTGPDRSATRQRVSVLVLRRWY